MGVRDYVTQVLGGIHSGWVEPEKPDRPAVHPHESALHADRWFRNLDERPFEIHTDELQITPSAEATGVLS